MAELDESLQSAVEELTAQARRASRRACAELEGAAGRGAPASAAEASSRGSRSGGVPPGARWPSSGRTLLVLAGAYLVRALTDGPASCRRRRASRSASPTPAFWQLRRRPRGAGRAAAERRLPRRGQQPDRLPADLGGDVALRARSARAPACTALVAFFALGLGVAWHRRLVANAVVTTALSPWPRRWPSSSPPTTCSRSSPRSSPSRPGLEWLAYRERLARPALVRRRSCSTPWRFLLVAVVTRPGVPEGYAALSGPRRRRRLLALPALYVGEPRGAHAAPRAAGHRVRGGAGRPRPAAGLRRRDGRCSAPTACSAAGPGVARPPPRRAVLRGGVRVRRAPAPARAATSTSTRPPAGC